jgi:hypothetical protein
MPPKKDTADGGAVKSQLEDFKDSETKLIAAAFLSSTGPDKVISYACACVALLHRSD